MRAAIAAGHPATVEAGIEVLEEGGSAADAAVAASLASCVAETVMTGLLGGGHAIHYEAASGRARNLDFFIAVPGIGAAPGGGPSCWSWRCRSAPSSCITRSGSRPPACRGAGRPRGASCRAWTATLGPPLRTGPAARARRRRAPAGSRVVPGDARAGDDHERGRGDLLAGRQLLQAGGQLRQPGLIRALELLADEGPRSAYTGSLAAALLALMDERGGLVTRDDLEAYEATWSEPVEAAYAGTRVLTRAGLAPLTDCLEALPVLRGLPPGERAVALAQALDRADAAGDTTNLVTVDAEGNACVLTSSLGLGAGDWLPGLDVHLNSMLGEADLIRGPLRAGERMGSMMSPTLAFDDDGPALAAGAAGGTRLRSALVQVLAGTLDEGLSAEEAVERPRLHPAAGVVHLEPGFPDEVAPALEAAGYTVRAWPELHHYFGGVSVVTRAGAAGDPRRSGSAALLPAG